VNGRRTWTLDPERYPLEKEQELVTYLHEHNQSFIMMVDPPVALLDNVSYNNGLQKDIYIKNPNGSVFVAAMWPGASKLLPHRRPTSDSTS
jgi:alpha-glucosidase